MPKFRDRDTWQQAEQLMQPAFIRLLDNIRKWLDAQSAWQGTYADVLVWPEGTDPAVKAEVMGLRSRLETATPEEVDEIEQALTQLPTPYPGYQLTLTRIGGHEVTVELWDLCYQICFHNYDSASGTSWTRGFGPTQNQSVEIDRTLMNRGEVDWIALDEKAKRIVERAFANLPAI